VTRFTVDCSARHNGAIDAVGVSTDQSNGCPSASDDLYMIVDATGNRSTTGVCVDTTT
jgi:hypothetical protein